MPLSGDEDPDGVKGPVHVGRAAWEEEEIFGWRRGCVRRRGRGDQRHEQRVSHCRGWSGRGRGEERRESEDGEALRRGWEETPQHDERRLSRVLGLDAARGRRLGDVVPPAPSLPHLVDQALSRVRAPGELVHRLAPLLDWAWAAIAIVHPAKEVLLPHLVDLYALERTHRKRVLLCDSNEADRAVLVTDSKDLGVRAPGDARHAESSLAKLDRRWTPSPQRSRREQELPRAHDGGTRVRIEGYPALIRDQQERGVERMEAQIDADRADIDQQRLTVQKCNVHVVPPNFDPTPTIQLVDSKPIVLDACTGRYAAAVNVVRLDGPVAEPQEKVRQRRGNCGAANVKVRVCACTSARRT